MQTNLSDLKKLRQKISMSHLSQLLWVVVPFYCTIKLPCVAKPPGLWVILLCTRFTSLNLQTLHKLVCSPPVPEKRTEGNNYHVMALKETFK